MARIYKAEEGLLAIQEEEVSKPPPEKFQIENKICDPQLTRLVAKRQKRRCCIRTIRGFVSGAAHIAFILSLCALFYILSRQHMQYRLQHIIAMAGIAVVSYIVIFIEANFSNTLISLRNFCPTKTIHNYVGEIYQARPNITWHAKCYHYGPEVNPDQEHLTGYDVQGKTSGKKVVSCEEKREFQFSSWKEVGRDIREFVSGGIIRLQCSKLFIFKDEGSRANYMQQYSEFRERCDQMDRFVKHSEDFSIEGFQESLTAGFSSTGRPKLMTELCYWISTALLLTWLYRAIYRIYTKKIYIIFIKEIGQ